MRFCSTLFLVLYFCWTCIGSAFSQNFEKTITELRKRVRGLKSVDGRRQQEVWNARLRIRKINYLQRVYKNRITPESYTKKIAQEIKWCRTALDKLNEKTYKPLRGELEEAYYSDIDNSCQPFIRYVPQKIVSRKYALIVYLHGYTPWLNLINWSYLPWTLKEFAEAEGIILLSPFARSNTDFQSVGETDVMCAIRNICERFPVDRDRIFLSGISMGGMGVWTIGGHYPDFFAGLIPYASRGSYYFWQKKKRSELPAYQQFLVDMEFGAEFHQNFRHQNIFLLHCTDDPVVNVSEGRFMRDLLKDNCPGMTYKEYPEGGHLISSKCFADPQLRQWILKTRRTVPRSFSFKTYHYRWNQAYFMTLNRFEKWGTPAEVRCSVKGRILTLNTKNVRRMTIKNVKTYYPNISKIVVDGAAYGVEQILSISQKVQRKTSGLEKKKGLSGPFRDILQNRFYMIEPRNENNGSALNLRTHIRYWYRYSKTLPLVIPEDKVDSNVERENIVLFGTPAQTPLLGKIVQNIPLSFHKNSFRFYGRNYDSKRYGIILTYPNPMNPGRYVTVIHGQVWGKGISENHIYDMIPDFIIFDATNQIECAGFFDKDWQLPKKKDNTLYYSIDLKTERPENVDKSAGD